MLLPRQLSVFPLHMSLLFAYGLFWTSVACCAIAQFFIIRSVRGNHHVPRPAASLPRQRDAMELIWAVIPALALAAALFFTWRAVRATDVVAAARGEFRAESVQ